MNVVKRQQSIAAKCVHQRATVVNANIAVTAAKTARK
jgi:hypothetical protein